MLSWSYSAIPTNVDIIESFKDDGIIPIKLQEDKELFEKYYIMVIICFMK